MHLIVSARDDQAALRAELLRLSPDFVIEERPAGLFLIKHPNLQDPPFQPLVFARQTLPGATFETAPSVRAWTQLLIHRILPVLPDDQPWRLHLLPHYGQGEAGARRCDLIRATLRKELQRRRRHLLRHLATDGRPFDPREAFVQLLLTAPDTGFLSVAPAPLPARLQRLVLWPFPKGEIPLASDPTAPSRAFAKLAEAQQRLDHTISPGQTCVDLGASPGSWTHLALGQGARVIAVDRAPLRPDVQRHPQLEFHRGDAFRFVPEQPVDWLLCDVIAAPERSIGLILDWTQHRRCRAFVVTIKFRGNQDYALLDALKVALPERCSRYFLLRLCANRNEACAAGVLRS